MELSYKGIEMIKNISSLGERLEKFHVENV